MGQPAYHLRPLRVVKGVAVMRRRSDGWLNATQILKVAGFDKPQRTRVLEREVQKGEHEKVQGGYGKYQGSPFIHLIPSPSLIDLKPRYLGSSGARPFACQAIQHWAFHPAHCGLYPS